MCLMFRRAKSFKFSRDGYKIARIKRRRPYDISTCKMPFTIIKNGYISRCHDNNIGGDDELAIYGNKVIKKEKEEAEENEQNDNKNQNTDNFEQNDIDCQIKKTVVDDKKKINYNHNKTQSQAKLTAILQKLIDRLPTGVFSLPKIAHVSGGTINHFSSTPSRLAELHHHQHHQHVSPRKRILRELEKVC